MTSADQLFREASNTVESSLRSFMDDRELPLYKMMAYHLGWVDEHGETSHRTPQERLRGVISILSAQASGGDGETGAAVSVAIELLFNFTQIHTDIQEGNPDRFSRPALWWVWGPAQGINAGDGMHALARLAILNQADADIDPKVISAELKTSDSATLQFCEGAYMDTVFQERLAVGVDEYLTMVTSISGSLAAAAAQLGFDSGSSTDEKLGAGLSSFGRDLGIVWRMREDHAAIWGSESVDEGAQGRIIAKKKTLPVVHALEQAEPSTRRELGNMYAQRVIDPANISHLRDILDQSGSKEFTEQQISQYTDSALASLQEAGVVGDVTDALKSLVDASTNG
ncbi:MAG: polyprenyl synthetase family protein [Chloroflexi bacterium]|nr:polyprenyl synthetase family protein [Chloroflexota bacterium]